MGHERKGKGGCGHVLKHLTGRRVPLKVLRPRLRGKELLGWLRNQVGGFINWGLVCYINSIMNPLNITNKTFKNIRILSNGIKITIWGHT